MGGSKAGVAFLSSHMAGVTFLASASLSWNDSRLAMPLCLEHPERANPVSIARASNRFDVEFAQFKLDKLRSSPGGVKSALIQASPYPPTIHGDELQT